MNNIFTIFANLLEDRLTLGVYTTEDSVRYTFFQALTQTGNYQHTDIVLEYPHPNIDRAQIDTLLNAKGPTSSVALEFKYDRRNPSDTNQNRTQRAGAVFKDLFRLAKVPGQTAQKKFFIYLTDDEMAGYFNNPKNGFSRLFALRSGEIFVIDANLISLRAKTFREVVETYQMNCTAIGSFRRDLSHDHSLRIIEIQP